MDLLIWDYKEQPDWAGIQKSLNRFQCPRIREVQTYSVDYCIVIGPKGMTQKQAQKCFDDFRESED